MARAARSGLLVRALPGIWVPATHATDPAMRAAALLTAAPNAVLTGRIAAALSWWPELPVSVVTASRHADVARAVGYRFHRQKVIPGHVIEWRGLRMTSPARTVLDLIPELGGHAIDEALRRRAATLAQLWQALRESPGRRHNNRRAWLLRDSRDEPWSEAERALHSLMRDVRPRCRFRTNHRVTSAAGVAFLDVAIASLHLGVEADGRAFHTSPASFERDRDRDTALAAEGWHVVRFSARQLFNAPVEVRTRIESIIRHRRRVSGALPRRGQAVP
ncbi:DUF559 domain-containing protein [Nigerium massiliense]|uniref:DUF559 domain-containing protein n=1 Tax=Nigerium massiliense TaxID=1522317 RepID=UPI0012FE0919|nr:DUF559 domain-containing protein [Nigerium massiliense]